MKLKKIETILIISILFGIYLSFNHNSFLKVSNLFMLIYITILMIKGTIPFTKKSFFIFLLICILGFFPYIIFDSFHLVSGIKYMYYIFQGFVIIFIIQRNKDFNWIKKIVTFYWFLNIILGCFEVIFGIHLKYANIYNYTQSINKVPLGLFFNQNDYGVFLSLIAPFIFIKFMSEKKGRIKYLLSMIINTILIISTGSIGAYITLALNLTLSYVILDKKHRKKILILPVLLTVISPGILLNKFLEYEYIFRKISRFSLQKSIIPLDRIEILSIYFSIFTDTIIGVGAGQATTFGMIKRGISINPHSLLMEIAVEFGVAGILFTLGIYIYALIKLLRIIIRFRNTSTEYIIGSVAAINLTTFFLWTNVPSRVLNGFDVFWIILGIVVVIINNPNLIKGDKVCEFS
ncbi:MAG: O-antigen ligase family protein [Halanaerobiales bacterium]|nr:O-antigen ligase family protein [Halanaerobiales bacterium]